MVNEPSAYSRVTRQMVIDIKEDIRELKDEVKVAFNHMSTRLPWWATAMITGLASLASALIARGVYIR